MYTEGSKAEKERAWAIQLTREYIERYSKEIEEKSFESEIEMLVSGADRLADYIEINNIDVVILTDKSGRYIRPLLEERILLRNPQAKLPQFCFLDIGTEKRTFINAIEEFTQNENVIEQARSGLLPFINESSNICVVDEFACGGESLRDCKKIVRRAFPNSSVSATYAFNGEPFWTPFDSLKDVVDLYELGITGEEEERPFTRGANQTLKNQEYGPIHAYIDPKSKENARYLRIALRYLAANAPVTESKPENGHPFIPEYVEPEVREELMS